MKECFQHRRSRFPKPEECPICLSRWPTYNYALDPCQHWVCLNCVLKSGKPKCPLCRTGIKIHPRNNLLLRTYLKAFDRGISGDQESVFTLLTSSITSLSSTETRGNDDSEFEDSIIRDDQTSVS
jgi:hypothetical protein